MRILHLLSSPFFSGPAEAVALLALEQRALGHEVSVAADRKRTHVAAEEPLAPKLRAWELLDEGGLELSVKSSARGFLRDGWRLRRRALDVLHAHMTHDHLLARWFAPPGACVVRSIHAPRSQRPSMPFADAFTVPFTSAAPAVRGKPTLVLPPMVEPRLAPPVDRTRLREALGVSGAPLVGMISTFQPSRRHAVALEAFSQLAARHPEARLLLLGDGALLDQTRAQVRSLGLSGQVVFAGYRAGEDYVRCLQALDEVWVLGLGNDYAGRAALQARRCGVRVVAVDEGGLSRWADALLPSPPEPGALAALAARPERRQLAPPDGRQVALDVLALYERARRGSA